MAPRAAFTVCSTSTSVCAAEITYDCPSTPRRRISCRNRVRIACGLPAGVGRAEDLARRTPQHGQELPDPGVRRRRRPRPPAPGPAAPSPPPGRGRPWGGPRARPGGTPPGPWSRPRSCSQQERAPPVRPQSGQLHELAPRRRSAATEPVAHRLAHVDRSGVDPVHRLRPPAAQRNPVIVVEPEDGAVPGAQRPHTSSIRGRLGQGAGPPRRFTHATGSALEHRRGATEVVVAEGPHQPPHRRGHPGTDRQGADEPVLRGGVRLVLAHRQISPPVAARARRSAALVASEAFLQNFTMSAPGTHSGSPRRPPAPARPGG